MMKEREVSERSQSEGVKGSDDQLLSEYLGPKESEKQLRGLYLINTRLWLDDLSKKYGTTITVGNIPEDEWNKLFEKYDNFWFMGIYKPSQKGQENAKKYCEQYRYYLPDIDREKDIVSSPFAIPEYYPNPSIAKDWGEWDQMVEKLHRKEKKVFIDFVPNHTALDHPWVVSHPEYYIQGNKQQYSDHPELFIEMTDNQGQVRYFAHGKDLYCYPWGDTLQLNYANLGLQQRMEEELINLAKHTDGFRCDMSVLISPKIFKKTWENYLSGEEKQNLENSIPHDDKKEDLTYSFWKRVAPKLKEIELIAEAYWEIDEIKEYFDYIYNHDLYNHIKKIHNTGSIGELKSHLDYLLKKPNQTNNRWVVYTENHDENRAVETMGEKFSKPAAVLSAMIKDSIFMINQGQETGCRYHPPMQVARYRDEKINLDISRFYDDLLSIRRSNLFQTGEIKILNSINGDQNSILLEITKADTKKRAIVAVNISQWTSYSEINKPETNFTIYNLTSGEKSNGDEVIDEKLILKLEPGEVKIVCLSTVLPENESIPQEIKTRPYF